MNKISTTYNQPIDYKVYLLIMFVFVVQPIFQSVFHLKTHQINVFKLFSINVLISKIIFLKNIF